MFGDFITAAFRRLRVRTPFPTPPSPSPTPSAPSSSERTFLPSLHSVSPSPPPTTVFSQRSIHYINQTEGDETIQMIDQRDEAGLTQCFSEDLVTWYAQDIWYIKRNTKDYLKSEFRVEDPRQKELQSKNRS